MTSLGTTSTDAPSELQFSNLNFEDWAGTSLNNESASVLLMIAG